MPRDLWLAWQDLAADKLKWQEMQAEHDKQLKQFHEQFEETLQHDTSETDKKLNFKKDEGTLTRKMCVLLLRAFQSRSRCSLGV